MKIHILYGGDGPSRGRSLALCGIVVSDLFSTAAFGKPPATCKNCLKVEKKATA